MSVFSDSAYRSILSDIFLEQIYGLQSKRCQSIQLSRIDWHQFYRLKSYDQEIRPPK